MRVRMHIICTVPLPVCLLPHPLSPFPLLLICLFLPLLPPPAPLALCRAASCFAALCAAAASCSLPALSFLQSALCACRPCAAASPPPLSASSPPLLCIAATASSCTACIRCHILCTQVEEFIPRMLRLRQKQPVAPGVPVVRAGGLCCHMRFAAMGAILLAIPLSSCSCCGMMVLHGGLVSGGACRLAIAARVWTLTVWHCGTRTWDARMLRSVCQQSASLHVRQQCGTDFCVATVRVI